MQTMDLATMEAIERQVEALDLSALVTGIGGLGATYPAVVSDDSSLRYTIDTVAEEWLHQYLTFTPLGWNYVLHLLGIREDYPIAQINESLAGIVTGRDRRRGMGAVLCAALAGSQTDACGARLIRLPCIYARDARAGGGTAGRGAVRRQRPGWRAGGRSWSLRATGSARLNQAYFAFHGTYADAPGSTTPIGDQLRALRATSTTLGDYLNTAVRLRTYDDLLDLLEQRGVGTLQLAPTP